MPEDFHPIPVVDIDPVAVSAIRAAGGTVQSQGEFAQVILPPGTKRKREGSDTLFKLPTGKIVCLSNHYLSYEE